jgi:hypothetical protein
MSVVNTKADEGEANLDYLTARQKQRFFTSINKGRKMKRREESKKSLR